MKSLSRKATIILILLLLIVSVIIIAVAVYIGRIQTAIKEAKECFAWADKIVVYVPDSDCSTKEDFPQELIRYSKWDSDVGGRIDSTPIRTGLHNEETLIELSPIRMLAVSIRKSPY